MEDNADARELLQDGLELLGYAVEAVEAAKRRSRCFSRDAAGYHCGRYRPARRGWLRVSAAGSPHPGMANVPAFAATGLWAARGRGAGA